MKNRAQQIVALLLRNPDVKIREIEEALNLSRRQIDYALKQLNDDLEQNGIDPVSRTTDGGFILNEKMLHYFSPTQHLETDVERNAEYYSEFDRMLWLLIYLLTSNETVSLNHLFYFLEVSKNTILLDLKLARKFIEKYQLTITYSRQDGYLLLGPELQIRMLINDLAARTKKANQRFLLDDSLKINVHPDDVTKIVLRVEKELDMNFSDEAFDYISLILLLNFARITSGKYQKTQFFQNKVTREPDFKKIISQLPDNYFSSNSDNEWIVLTFLAANVYRNDGVSSDDPLYTYVAEMIEEFEQATLIQIQDKQAFGGRLLAHLRPAYFRVKYDLPLLGDYHDILGATSENHQILIDLIGELIEPLEHLMGKKFPQSEIELLSSYFGTVLNTYDEESTLKQRAVVVCTNGMVISKLMLETLTDLFPEIHFLSSMSIRDFEEILDDYDLVFTNVPLLTSMPQYIINPLMSYQEKINLRYRVLNQLSHDAMKNQIDDLLSIFNRFGNIEKENDLREELKSHLLKQNLKLERDDNTNLPHLNIYIKPEYIQKISHVENWKVAIQIASEPLIKHGVISPHYIEELILQNEDETCYSFLGDVMSIPHYQSDEDIYRDGISLLILDTPIDFPSKKGIRIIAPIAIKNTSLHLRAINQLALIAETKDLYQELLSANNHKLIETLITQIP